MKFEFCWENTSYTIVVKLLVVDDVDNKDFLTRLACWPKSDKNRKKSFRRTYDGFYGEKVRGHYCDTSI